MFRDPHEPETNKEKHTKFTGTAQKTKSTALLNCLIVQRTIFFIIDIPSHIYK